MKYMPLIGITPGYDYDNNRMYIKNGYTEGIIRSGGLPFLIPLTADKGTWEGALGKCDGILFSGGPDIDARHFGEINRPFNGDISPLRDSLELYLARKAVEREIPILGICRGIQVINVALGGTLYQDIQAQVSDREVIKHSQSAPVWYPTHEIIIDKGSKVSEAFGSEHATINSFHHQAVKELASGFKVTSRASDGIIESIEYCGDLFAVGVQWHPELMWQEDRIYLRLFEDFVKAASRQLTDK